LAEEICSENITAGLKDQGQTMMLPFIARLATAPAATRLIVSSSELCRSMSKDPKPPASTIFSWFASEMTGTRELNHGIKALHLMVHQNTT